MKISASILSADFATLGADVAAIDKAGADWIHIDAFDGHFVPTLTIGPKIIASLKKHTQKPIDVHYMAENPEKYIQPTAEAGADLMTVHLEACKNPQQTIIDIKNAGMEAGLALMLNTPAEAVFPYLEELDLVLVMTVRGGFGGDPFQESMISKIEEVYQQIQTLPEDKRPEISVDGGVSTQTIAKLAKAGCTVFCAGSSVFGSPRSPTSYADNIKALRTAAMT